MELERTLLKISDITRGRVSRSQTYSDFLAYCALLLSSRTDPVHAEQRHNTLHQLCSRYEAHEWEAFQQGFKILVSVVSQNICMGRFDDLFAKTYIQLGAASQSLKQNFSPPCLSELMAAIAFAPETSLPPEGFFTIGDPACGSGTLLLAAAERMAANGFHPTAHMVVQAADLNARCAHMAYLNLSLYGIPAVVVRGDTIALEEYDRWYTPAYLWGKWIWRAPMPFGKGGYISDEMLKRLDEPMYDALRRIEALSCPVNAGHIADELGEHTEKKEVQK